ncbi:GerAB/ArcD/ProY family transporter [Fictibacillus sp. 7GRE50]|uniref:GerAB/ArcD/ProY family transporter n=1 Tax=Fictibacillus sp. 7GRE50 TaxID=2745878 RepID=UPI0018CF13A6|nr:GerAB/ArcD/ProY family transporter [Fictibacillus sp. 7GRE50]MBH0166188.1 GerAB/ArcD/ProY family transporter [Fictibacillus sp. 7GRE50]
MNSSHTITHRQLFFVLIQSQIGVGVLSLPYTLFAKAKTDGWISLLLAGIFIQFSILAIWKLCEMYPKQTIFDFMPKILGNKLGLLLNILFIVHLFSVCIVILILYNNIVSKWIFFQTPRFIVIIILALTCVYCITCTAREIARFLMLCSPLLLILFFFVGYAYTDVHLLYAFPVGATGIKTIISTSTDAVIALLGFDTALVFLAYTEGKSTSKLKAMSYTSLCVTLFYCFVTFTTYIFFNPAEIVIVPEPVLYMLKAFSFKFLERTDLIFLTIWIVSVTTSLISYLFFTAKGVQTLFKLHHHKSAAPYVGIICALIASIPGSKLDVQMWSKTIGMTAMIFSALFPILLLLIAIIRKRKEKGAAST